MQPANPIRDKVAAEIGRRIGRHKVKTAPEIRISYAFDATNIRRAPLAVVFPEAAEDVEAVLEVCAAGSLPVVPRGAGTGFAGGTVPPEGGVVLSTERLCRTVSIDPDRRQAVVEPGVVNAALQREAAKSGLMFPPDPSSMEVCTIGGNVAQDSGGPRALKYGVTRDYVLGVEAVLYGGRTLDFDSTRIREGAWNPATALMVGSEGTLAVFTRMYLKLIPRPQSYATALAFFTTSRGAASAVNLIFDQGVVPAALELVDGETMKCITRFVSIDVPPGAGCSLLVETDGRRGEAREAMSAVERGLRAAGFLELRIAGSERERDDLWRMRRSVSPSLARLAPWKLNEDLCVPRSNLPLLVDAVGRLGRKYALRVPTFGHAGDGNLHVNVMFDRRVPDELARAESLAGELFEATLSLGGSISGEHGIGLTKKEFLPNQLGAQAMEYQKCVKRAFDPRGLLNPGKVLG
jgi:glycolate oxidase